LGDRAATMLVALWPREHRQKALDGAPVERTGRGSRTQHLSRVRRDVTTAFLVFATLLVVVVVMLVVVIIMVVGVLLLVVLARVVLGLVILGGCEQRAIDVEFVLVLAVLVLLFRGDDLDRQLAQH